MKQIAVIIPAYNESKTIRDIAQRVLVHCEHVIVVDDGSNDETSAAIKDLPVVLLRNKFNQGKAVSLWKGIQTALKADVSEVITLDADGQHLPEDIPRFIEMGEANPCRIIIGSRLANKAVFPLRRYYANKFANFWISWASGYYIEDSQSGFRLYPASMLKKLSFKYDKSDNFVFDSEILIEAAKHGFFSLPLSISAIYNDNARPSHFRPVLDILRITRMVARNLASQGFSLQKLYKSFIHPDFPKRRLGVIGADGLAMLLLSNLVIPATGGLLLLWLLCHVYRVAKQTPCTVDSFGCLLVPGVRLQRDTVTRDYALRLNKAKKLLDSQPGSQIFVLGGRTGTSVISEAQAGQDYLLALKIPQSKVRVEDYSSHTLENMQRARNMLAGMGSKQVILITNRYHLARCKVLADGLGIAHRLCAAEDRLQLTFTAILKMINEAYFLHWYHVGKAWSLWTNNKRMLSRIS